MSLYASRAAPRFHLGFWYVVSVCCFFRMLFTYRVSEAEAEIIPLINHFALQRLAFYGFSKDVISVLARLPLFAPCTLVGILFDSSRLGGEPGLMKIPESEFKAVDLALSDSKFPHLTSIQFIEHPEEPIENPHILFRRILPNSYMRGILWYQRRHEGMSFLLWLCFSGF